MSAASRRCVATVGGAVGTALILAGAFGCTTAAVAPRVQVVGRIAVLPPRGPEYGDAGGAGSTAAAVAPRLSLGEVLAAAARTQLAAQGFAVVDAARVAAATGGRQPTDVATAAQMVAGTDLDATAMFIAVQIWQPSYDGMRTDSVIVALDVDLIDPRTEQSLWHVHRAAKPVPLYGMLLTGQADIFAAETLMREVLAPLGATPARG